MTSLSITPQPTAQEHSAGGSCADIHAAALMAAQPRPGLSWLDVGCGTGELLRTIAQDLEPSRLVGLDIIDWLAADLRCSVETVIGPAESVLVHADPADRVLLVETIEQSGSALDRAAGSCAPCASVRPARRQHT
jgi:precorrin-6B methylase 2